MEFEKANFYCFENKKKRRTSNEMDKMIDIDTGTELIKCEFLNADGKLLDF